jgi:hypothetical protein
VGIESDTDETSASVVFEGAGVSSALLVLDGVVVGILAAVVDGAGTSLGVAGEDPGMFLGAGRVYTEHGQHDSRILGKTTNLRGRVLCCH